MERRLSSDDSHTTKEAKRSGFELFKFELAGLLTEEICERLARCLKHSNPEKVASCPFLDFVNLMEERGEISEDSIDDLLAALLWLDLKGVKKKVEDFYESFKISLFNEDFIDELSGLLTPKICQRLATHFKYQQEQDDKWKNAKHLLLKMAEDSKITLDDITPLMEALVELKLTDLRNQVEDLFVKKQIPSPTKDEIENFRKTLKEKYEEFYSCIQPIPYIREKFSVDKIFVETGMELRDKSTLAFDKWVKMSSYKDILSDAFKSTKAETKLIEGKPGHGKSTLALQMTYDWCQSHDKEGLAANLGILIYLPLRQLKGVRSIYKAISQFLLPTGCGINEWKVRKIIEESTSVVILFDGYDEYPDQGELDSHISLILKKKMLKEKIVVLTTRPTNTSEDLKEPISRIRLTGFTDEAREIYIKKTVGPDNDLAEKMKKTIEQSSVLEDLFITPFFFVMYVHMATNDGDNYDLSQVETVTEFFKHLTWCMKAHLTNKTQNAVKATNITWKDDGKLNEVAFEALFAPDQQTNIVWESDNLRNKLGDELYHQSIQLGILVEETVLDYAKSNMQYPEYKQNVRFCHKLLCEWHAGRHLVKCFSSDKSVMVRVLDGEKYEKHEYLYRFASGLDENASGEIVRYLKEKKRLSDAINCKIEQNWEDLDDLTDFVKNTIIINKHDSDLLQRKTAQILRLASQKALTIQHLCINQSLERVDIDDVTLTSGVRLKRLESVKKVEIVKPEKSEVKRDEFVKILTYGGHSSQIRDLWTWQCLLPEMIPVDLIPESLKLSDVEVTWIPYYVLSESYVEYRLDVHSGKWLNRYTDEPMTEREYLVMKEDFR